MTVRLLLLALAWLLTAPRLGRTAPPPTVDSSPVQLARDGRALLPVIIHPEASAEVRTAAEELSEYLGRISGGEFRVQTGNGTSGIVVGLQSSFTDLPFQLDFPTGEIQRDQYVLRTSEQGLFLLGTTPAAVECAVWDFLARQGYRLYFLTDTWEIVPQRPDLSADLLVLEQPDYVTRQAPRGSPWSDRELWERWQKRNGMNSSFTLHTGHAYGGIVSNNRQAFEEHPEYFALVNGQRKSGDNAKFCISNPALRQLVVDDAVRRTQADPQRDSLSMDPSDGRGWCECEACLAMGTVSDRALTLANEVALAINDLGLGEKYVGMYAYNQHSPPPNIQAHPRVVISVATSFIRGGYSVEQLVSGWQAKNATIGIRDYHDVFAWSHDLPRQARGGNIDYLTRTTSWFHQHGARFMNSENMDSWGANGLGYWLTPRLLWDVDNAERVDALIEDFLEHAFGSAKQPMREFYRLLNRDHDTVRSHQDVVARMYRQLDEARQASDDPQVRARLADLILYTRYLELYHHYRTADGEARQQGFEQVWRHAYRMRGRMMLTTRAICERDRFRDSSVHVPAEAAWDVPEEKNPWKRSDPFGDAEIAEILAAGIAANEPTVLDFEARQYSEDLVPSAPLSLPHVAPGSYDNRFRGRQQAYTWFTEGSQEIELEVTGGLIEHYRDRGNVQFSLHAQQEATLDAVDQDASVTPDGQPRKIALSSSYDGLHRLEWTDGSDMTRVVWPENQPLTIRSSLDEPMRLTGRWHLYFYVPRGTTVVGGYSGSNLGRMLDSDGKVVFDFSSLPAAGYFSVPVPEGQDAGLWKFENCQGTRMLMTVPPYLAPSEKQLLLPREVIEADAK